MAKMLFDASRGLNVLQHLSIVDGNRLGVMGHSLGAKEALSVYELYGEPCSTAVQGYSITKRGTVCPMWPSFGVINEC